jgi:hypothetical protein
VYGGKICIKNSFVLWGKAHAARNGGQIGKQKNDLGQNIHLVLKMFGYYGATIIYWFDYFFLRLYLNTIASIHFRHATIDVATSKFPGSPHGIFGPKETSPTTTGAADAVFLYKKGPPLSPGQLTFALASGDVQK